MSIARFLVLSVALTAFAMRLFLREYWMEILLPQFRHPEPHDDDDDNDDNDNDNDSSSKTHPKRYIMPTCTVDHVTTSSWEDLQVLLPPSSSVTATNETTLTTTTTTSAAAPTDLVVVVQDALTKMDTHGVIVWPDLLSRPETKALRKYILQENKNPTRNDWFVLNGEHRTHLTFDLYENKIITQAIHKILSSEPLRQVLVQQLVMGDELEGNDDDKAENEQSADAPASSTSTSTTSLDNVALLELASITSTAGAGGQQWHKDVSPTGREIPMVSLFVNLQELSSSAQQGPTALCAGTHKCLGKKLKCWDKATLATTPAGSAVLMNSQLYHRGTAHELYPTDSLNNSDTTARVMFYLSFGLAPTASTRKDRIPPLGATYALSARLWGRTAQQVWEATQTFQTTSSRTPWRRFSSWWTSLFGWSSSSLFGSSSSSDHPHPRGWTLMEIASVNWAADKAYNRIRIEQVEEEAEQCTFLALWVFVLYAFIVEMDAFGQYLHKVLWGRRQEPTQKEEGANSNSNNDGGLNKAKVH